MQNIKMAENTQSNKPRAKKMRKRKQEQLSLEFIEEFGGNKEDLHLLEDIDDNDNVEDVDFDGDDDEPSQEEINKMINKLGLHLHRPDFNKEKKKKKKKLVTADSDDEDAADETTQASTATANDSTETKKKKKEKNKFKTAEDNDETDLPETKAKAMSKNKKEEKKKKGKPEAGHAETAATEDGKKKKKITKKDKVQHAEVSSTTVFGDEELRNHLKMTPHRKQLLVKPQDSWIDHQEKSGSSAEEVTKALIQQCERFVAKLLEDEVALYNKQQEERLKGKYYFMKKVLASGTLTDKMATLMDLVVQSPVHNLAALDSLVSMVSKKGKREAMLAADSLKNTILSEAGPFPGDRKLIAFSDRPFASLWHSCSGNKESVDKKLLVWYVEDQMKQKYAAFVKALDVMSFDTLLAAKEKAVSIMHSLIVSKPEQEDVLLPKLVNKLGDNQVAAKASYLLIKLVEEHPNMKEIIVNEVEYLVYRPNISKRAQYYAICFLMQIKLHRADQALATRLIKVYFSFFKVYVNKGEIDNKMMSALLTGVNRAYPYAKLKEDFLSEELQTLFKLVHQVNISTSIQALMLLHQVVDPSKNDGDRYYMALYRKLLDPELGTSAKLPQFLNLVYKSLKADVVDKRVKAVMKRLLQRGIHLGPNFLCGALIVISEILRLKPGLLTLKQVGQSTQGDQTSGVFDDGDDDDEERFVDLPPPPEFLEEGEQDSAAATEVEQATAVQGEKENADGQSQTKGGSSWVHRTNLTGKSELEGYNAYQRNPLHCHAQNECWWELLALTRHHHPSVSLFASTILKGKPITYDGDPLEDFNLIRFLDRFVYKNPKKKQTGDVRQETVGAASARKQAVRVAANSVEFISQGESAVPEHEKFLYIYQTQAAVKKKKKEEEDEESDDTVSDSEFDDFLDKTEMKMDPDDLGDLDMSDDEGDKKKKKKKKGKKDDDLSEDDFDLADDDVEFADDELRDDDLAAEFAKEMEGVYDNDEVGDEFDEDDDVEFDDDEDEDFDEDEFEEMDDEDAEDGDEDDDDVSGDELKAMMSGSSGKKRKKGSAEDSPPKKKTKKSKVGNLDSLFANAEDFDEIIEENAESATAFSGTSHDVSNKDKASVKQIAWEADRERKMRGTDWKRNKNRHGGKGKPKFSFKGGKPGGDKGNNQNKGRNFSSKGGKGYKPQGKKGENFSNKGHNSGNKGHNPGNKGHNSGSKGQNSGNKGHNPGNKGHNKGGWKKGGGGGKNFHKKK